MKKVIVSFSVVALMLVGSVLNAQDAGCSSCGQQSLVQPSFVQPVTYNQPVVATTPTFAQTTPTFAQAATTGCTSCGQQSFVQPVSYSQPIVATTPVYTQPVSTGCTSCGTANVVSQAPVCSTCSTNTRGGLFRGRSGGQGGLMGSAASSRLLRAGLFNSIRN